MVKVAILGSGNIGSSLISSAISRGYEVIGTGRTDVTLRRVLELGAKATSNNQEAISTSDLILISVKPQHFPDLVRGTTRNIWRDKVVVSVMAGVRLETLKRIMEGASVFRAMPNINATVKMSTTALTGDGRGKELVETFFKGLGSTYWINEDFMDVWTALIGSGPAFVSEIIDSLVLGAVASGMPRELAYSAVLDMLEGTARNLRSHKGHPAEVRDNVITPAGTTIRGLKVMEEKGVKAALIETVESASKRASELGRVIDGRIKEDTERW
ncbi:pyrroline-5-carboxylate reductase [Metallosphaera tengchongensis]|uniref:Pyrroline-5-carboxylate reductase n=1 Tax=Metallosphaera tengchongensis TaxID=1532350 RepID=A0A6N0NQQ3_9CREN|nr:pyrroline-5-carboxylate reductase [Metallosphaera tengchongensis]QKQ99021.1 pyrroline-5-carboxylate reductase [Metallosphaera tengchongensis]